MTDADLLLILSGTPRTLSPEEVEQRVGERDREQGPYVSPGQTVHHCAQEARH